MAAVNMRTGSPPTSTARSAARRTNSFTYTNDLVCTHLDERGVTTTSAYDNFGRIASVSDPRGAITYTYSNLDLVKVTDRMGFSENFVYDRLRRLAYKTNALGFFTQYNYCSCGALDSICDAQGNYTYFFYDNAGRLFNTVYPDKYAITNSFDLLGRIVTATDSGGYSAANWFNNQGLRYAVSGTFGWLQYLTFDDEDRATNAVDINGVATASTFDNLGRMLTRKYSDNGVESYAYSTSGLVAYTTQIGASNYFAYDAAGRRTFETNANNELIRYTNNPAGDLIALTDGKTQTTRWNYDEYGRVTNKLDQTGVEILRYAYDPDNRLTNRWSAARNNTHYSYDPVGNLLAVSYPLSPSINFSYDELNRLTNMVDASGTTKYTYTAGNQLLSEDGPWDSDTVTFGYTNRLRTSLNLQQPTGAWTNGLSFDAAHRVTNIISQAGSFKYSYAPNLASRLTIQLALPAGFFITNQYDVVARLTDTALYSAPTTVAERSTYTYNQAGQRITFQPPAVPRYAFTYDPIGQLKSATNGQPSYNRGYLYDAAGNLLTLTNQGSTSTFTVDSKNEAISQPTYTNAFDANGNLISRNNSSTGVPFHTFAYDDENQLTNITTSSRRTDMTYDGLGRLRKRDEFTGSPGAWTLSSETRYIYDRNLVIQQRDANNTPTISFTRGTDLSGTFQGAGGIGGLLACSEGYSSGNWTTNNFYHADGSGNITRLFSTNPVVFINIAYDPFGNIILSSAHLLNSANPYGFSSKEGLQNSAMRYYGYRFYDPNLQRWINRDPIQERGNLNLYSFAQNMVPNMVDKLGLQVVPPGVAPFPGPNMLPEPGNSLSDPNNPMNHLERPEGDGSIGDTFLDWLADRISHTDPTPEQAEWDRQYGPQNPFWPPNDGHPSLIPSRPPNRPPAKPAKPTRPPRKPCPTQGFYFGPFGGAGAFQGFGNDPPENGNEDLDLGGEGVHA
jgi:RHS repeat-associated protein